MPTFRFHRGAYKDSIENELLSEIKLVVENREKIIEDFCKTWLAVNLPEGKSIFESAMWYINNCVLNVAQPKLIETEDGKCIVQKFWMEYKD